MRLRFLLWAAAMVLVAVSGFSRAAAEERSGSGLPEAPGNPLAALQAQLDALAARVVELERGGATPRHRYAYRRAAHYHLQPARHFTGPAGGFGLNADLLGQP